MQAEERTKPPRETVVLAYLICFVVTALAITGNIYLFAQVSLLDSQLKTYVLLAAKSHASLMVERGDYRLYVPTSEVQGSERPADSSVRHIPVSSKWDNLYVTTYNEVMKSALGQSGTNSLAVPPRGEE